MSSPWSTLEKVRIGIGKIFSGDRGGVLVFLSFGWLLSLGSRLAVPALLPYIRESFSAEFSNTFAGILITALSLAYALSQFPGGILADKSGERIILVVSTVVTSLGLLGIVLASTVQILVLSIVLFGLGTGLFGTTRITALADLYPHRGSLAIGITNASGNLGSAGIPIVAGLLAGEFGWRIGFGTILPPIIVTGIALAATMPKRTSPHFINEKGSNSREASRQILPQFRRRPILLAWVTSVLLAFVYQGYISFLPIYLSQSPTVNQQTATILYGLVFCGAVIIQPIAGSFADSYGRRWTLLAITIITTPSLILITMVDNIIYFLILILLSSIQTGVWPIIYEYTTRELPVEIQGGALGLFRSSSLFLAAMGPVVIGIFADSGLLNEAYQLLAGVVLLTFFIFLFFPNDV